MAEFAGLTHLLAQQAERLGVNSADQSENLISSAASPSALDAVAAGEPLTDREAFPAGSRLCLHRADEPRIGCGRSDAGAGRPIHYRLNTHCLPPPQTLRILRVGSPLSDLPSAKSSRSGRVCVPGAGRHRPTQELRVRTLVFVRTGPRTTLSDSQQASSAQADLFFQSPEPPRP
jgi:hypothetical protein